MSRPQNAPPTDLLTSGDAARILGLSSDMVRLLARNGKLSTAAESVGGIRLFRKADVVALAGERAGNIVHDDVAQFYDDPDFLTRVVADFADSALKARATVVIIATKERHEAVLEQLASSGHDVNERRSSRSLTILDVRETLQKFLVSGAPDPVLFRKNVGCLIDQRGRATRTRLHVYSEMADVLCCDGRPHTALRCEELWHGVVRTSRLSRLCAYAMDSFRTGADSRWFQSICALHPRVLPTERYSDAVDPQERLRNIAILEQQARALKGEVELRYRAENELRKFKAHVRDGKPLVAKVGAGE